MAKRTIHQKMAQRAINGLTAFGTSKKDPDAEPDKIRSVATANQYEGIFKRFSEWRAEQGIKTKLSEATVPQAEKFLRDLKPVIMQKNLSNHRNALQMHLRNVRAESHAKNPINLHRHQSTKGEPSTTPRALNREQVKRIIATAPQLETKVAIVRTHELITLATFEERPVTYRSEKWHPERFSGGRENWHRYSVIGKGNLPREVRVSPETHKQLETLRFGTPQPRTDRKIDYTQRYDLTSGQNLSERFKELAIKANGFNTGAHGLRHSFAQNRRVELMADGRTEKEADKILTQEVGHWSTSNLKYYLR